MIEDQQNYFQIEEKFLVVLDSKLANAYGSSSSTNIDNVIQQIDEYKLYSSVYSQKSDLIFTLESPISKTIDDIQLKCCIKNAVFPNSFYNINILNSRLAIYILDDGGNPVANGNLVIDLPFGNYNTETLRKELFNLLDAEILQSGFSTTNDFNFDILYDNITCKYTFQMYSYNLPAYANFYISFQPQDIVLNQSVSQLGDVLGFMNDIRYFSGNTITNFNTNSIFSGINRRIEAIFPSNLSGIKCFNIILKNYNTYSIPSKSMNSPIGFKNSIINGVYNNTTIKQTNKKNIIANVICNCNPFEYIFYTEQNSFYIDMKEPVLNQIHIQIADNLGSLVDFNNQDWSITLEFSLMKKKEYKTRSFYEILQNGRF